MCHERELWIALIICAKIMFSIQKNVFELQDETNLKYPNLESHIRMCMNLPCTLTAFILISFSNHIFKHS